MAAKISRSSGSKFWGSRESLASAQVLIARDWEFNFEPRIPIEVE